MASATSSPGTRPGQFNGLDQQLHGILIGRQVRCETALVPYGGGQATLGEDGSQCVIGLGPPAKRLAERGGTDRHQHEFLEVDGVAGVGTAVEHVQHRDRATRAR